MSTNTNNQAAGREAQESSGQSSEMKIRVDIPPEIVAPNHRRAYALGFIAGYKGELLKFIAPIVRNSIVRGYLNGQRAAQAGA